MTVEKTYYPQGYPVVNNEVTDAALAYVKPLMVARSGVEHSLTDIDALLLSGQPFYQYIPGSGTLVFNPFNPFQQDESINIIYAIP